MDADQIEKIAKDANDTSAKAYNLLLKSIDGESKMADEIDKLNKMWVSFQFVWMKTVLKGQKHKDSVFGICFVSLVASCHISFHLCSVC